MTVIWFAYFALYLIALSPSLLYAKILTKQGKIEKRNALVRKHAKKLIRRISRLAGVTFDIQGLENVPKDRNVVYIANHQGIFDVIALMMVPPEICGFLAKQELSKIPLARTWLEYMGCIFVNREKPREAVAALDMAEEKVRNGESFIIFPEGTRSKTAKWASSRTSLQSREEYGRAYSARCPRGTYKAWEEKKDFSAKVKSECCLPLKQRHDKRGIQGHRRKSQGTDCKRKPPRRLKIGKPAFCLVFRGP